MTTPPQRPDRAALAAAVTSFVTWGLFPLLFQAVGRAGATVWEVVGWRILSAVPLALLLVAVTGKLPELRGLARQPRTLGLLALTGLLIGVNWGVYIWAVQHGQTLATSLGYYLNPLLNVAAGAALFRERLNLAARTALALATVGVAVQAWAVGAPPWIALVIAASFGAYGVIRKQTPVAAQTGLLVETLVLTPPSAAFVAWEMAHGDGAFGHSALATALLLFCGLVTVIPLTTFSFAARRLPLSVLGFLQFIQPTLLFAVGALQGEAVTPARLISFAFIWAGVAVFVAGLARSAGQRAA